MTHTRAFDSHLLRQLHRARGCRDTLLVFLQRKEQQQTLKFLKVGNPGPTQTSLASARGGRGVRPSGAQSTCRSGIVKEKIGGQKYEDLTKQSGQPLSFAIILCACDFNYISRCDSQPICDTNRACFSSGDFSLAAFSELFALRQQLAVLKRKHPRPQIAVVDRHC